MKEFKLDNEQKISAGFKIPERYFDDFESKVTQRLAQREKPVRSLFTKRNWLYAAAAVFVVSLSIPVFNYVNTANSSNIDEASLENYLIDHAEITDADLVEVLNTEELHQMKIDLKIEDQELEDILSTNTNLEEYLIN